MLVIISASLVPLYHHYTSESADWRGVGNYLLTHARENDLIIVEPSSERFSFLYYYQDGLGYVTGATEYEGTPSRTLKHIKNHPHEKYHPHEMRRGETGVGRKQNVSTD